MIVDEVNEQGAYPGMMLVANLSEMTSGQGTYVYLGKIYSNVNGTIIIHKKGTWHNPQGPLDVIMVEPLIKDEKAEVDELLGKVDSTAPLSN